MTVAASSPLFAVVFTLFVVAALALVVLTLRFTVGQARRSRAAWLAGRAVGPDGMANESDEADAADAAAEYEHEEEPEEEGMTALVLAGGSTRGAIQIGMLQVLAEHGFVPDRVYGASVGAINGAGFADDPTREGVERMAQIWLGLRREDVYPQGRLHGPWLYFQQRDAVYSNSGLRNLISQGFSHERLEESTLPLEVVATSLTDGGERWFIQGPAVEAILASAAMPAIFPPVEIDGERYIDGGVVDNVPIQRAIDAGATRIVVLLCSPPIVTPQPSKRPVEGMVNALLIAIHARFVRDMSHLPDGVEVILCSGPEGATRDFDDFSTTEHLIALGRAEASEIVRRYALGTIPYPAPPVPVEAATAPSGDQDADHPADETVAPTTTKPGPDPDRTVVGPGPGPGTDVDGHSPGPASPVPAAPGPVTQPDPGT